MEIISEAMKWVPERPQPVIRGTQVRVGQVGERERSGRGVMEDVEGNVGGGVGGGGMF